ncbi:condensation domain-containing protein [Catenulispora pinisilvae]|uniref:condensation domain-containing protein n=1 Tax=Catenulispora pinisilvae TaxID=2705253 RepID=UPI001892192F|nr:condensation domain-containing protein [Catenulispora pinisilvae]
MTRLDSEPDEYREIREIRGITGDSGPDDVRVVLSEAWHELLDIDGVSPDSNFYSEGGTSVTSMLLLAKMLDKGFQARLSELIACRTFGEQLALFTSARAEQGEATQDSVLTAKQELQLARIKKQIKARGSADAKPVPLVLEISGDVDHDLLSQSLVDLVRRHDVLTTGFIDSHGEIAPTRTDFADTWKPERMDLTAFSRQEALARIWAHIGEVAQAGLAYDTTPVILGAVAAVRSDLTFAVLVIDHLVSDAESLGVLYEDLTQIYSAKVEGRPSDLAEQLTSVHAAPVEKERYGAAGWPTLAAKWREYFAQYPEPPAFDLLGPVGCRDYGQSVPSATTLTNFVVPAQTVAKLKATYRRLGLSPLSVMLGAMYLAAHIVSGMRDICIINPRSRRNGAGEMRVVNDFAEPTVIRVRPSGASCPCHLTLAEVAALAADSQARASELEMPRKAVMAFSQGGGAPSSPSRVMIGSTLRAAREDQSGSMDVAEARTDVNAVPWLWCNYTKTGVSSRPMGEATATFVEQELGGDPNVSNLMVFIADDDNELVVNMVVPHKLYPRSVVSEFGETLMLALGRFAEDPDRPMAASGPAPCTARAEHRQLPDMVGAPAMTSRS